MKVFAVAVICVVVMAATEAYLFPFGRFGGFPFGMMGRFPGLLPYGPGFPYPGYMGMSMGYNYPYTQGYGTVPEYPAVAGATQGSAAYNTAPPQSDPAATNAVMPY